MSNKRSLHFPNHSIGTLVCRDSFEFERQQVAAEGTVYVCSEYRIFLTISTCDLSFLQEFAASEFFAISFASGCSLDDERLRDLYHLTGLRQLNLANYPITDSGSENLIANLNKLTRLSLRGSQITNQCLNAIKELSTLVKLDLGCTAIDDDGIEKLMDTTIEYLDLSDTRITDASMKSVSRMRRLKTLKLAGTQISNDGLALLSLSKSLETLDMTATPVTDSGLQHLKSMDTLNQINLSATLTTEEGVKQLCNKLGSDFSLASPKEIYKYVVEPSSQVVRVGCVIYHPADEADWSMGEDASDPVLSYQSIIAWLPRPTEQQCKNFAEYVASAHSWYKKLPLLSGMKFVFFLNPAAGAGCEPAPRLKFLCSTSDEYRRRFGFLDYLVLGGFDKEVSFSIDGFRLCLPHELVEQSSCTIYPYLGDDAINFHDDDWARLAKGGFHPQREKLIEWWQIHQEQIRVFSKILQIQEKDPSGIYKLSHDHVLRLAHDELKHREGLIADQLRQGEREKIWNALLKLREWLTEN